jgi:tyrosyl-tRNA synthetase
MTNQKESRMQFHYAKPGLTLSGKPVPPYINTTHERILLNSDEDIKLKAESVPKEVKDHLKEIVETIIRKSGEPLSGNCEIEQMDTFYHDVFSERQDTHLKLSSQNYNMQHITQIINRRVCKAIDAESAVQKLCSGKKLNVKYGIDPTGAKLHLGHLIPIYLLRDLESLGHNINFLVGNFTARIGDPTGRSDERSELSSEQINLNLADYVNQVSPILSPDKVNFVYNDDWYSKMSLKEFFSTLSPFTLNAFSNRDFVKSRGEQGLGVSLREFLYPVLQGFDSVVLNADLVVSGVDQEFNELQGRTLQHLYGQKPQDLLMTALLPGLDGRKMSKSFQNCIFLTDSPVEIYGKTMSLKDELISTYFDLIADLEPEEISDIKVSLDKGVNPRDIKMILAWTLVKQIHNENAANEAQSDFKCKFQQRSIPEIMPVFTLQNGIYSAVEILVSSGMIASNNEARRSIQNGSIRINGEKIMDLNQSLVIDCQELILQFGKRKFIRIMGK